MSKIIVDQIQKSGGGSIISFPENDGAANSPIVATGVLGQVIVGNTSLPTCSGTVGQALASNGANSLVFTSLPAGISSAGTTVYGNATILVPPKEAMLQDVVGSVIVGETSYYCSSAGNCCLWTVPTGVTKAEFQIWGGGGIGIGCSANCCSFGSAGGTGEYTYVIMDVTAGQQYTLCAGGASTVGGCYSYCNGPGCNSFVCGANSTCILSCGGTGCYTTLCGTTAICLYPEAAKSNYTRVQSSVMACTESFACSGSWFGQIAFRCRGQSTGGITSNNTLHHVTKVPSYIGRVKQCGNSICYMQYETLHIDTCHNVNVVCTPWTGYSEAGCFTDGCAVWNLPGMGGPAPISACSEPGGYGGRGRSGLIKVNYK